MFNEKTIMPFNYRELSLDFNDSLISVVGLALPTYQDQDAQDTFAYLKDHNVSLVVGLEPRLEFMAIAHENQLHYVDWKVEDFTAPSIELLDWIYREVLHQAQRGKKVAIHCHAGLGRTGTVLAALKLRELLQKNSFSLLERCSVTVNNNIQVVCTQAVYEAIAAVRSLPTQGVAIEVPEQVTTLCHYELLLRNR
jgi:protein-tyrosine phosphatase